METQTLSYRELTYKITSMIPCQHIIEIDTNIEPIRTNQCFKDSEYTTYHLISKQQAEYLLNYTQDENILYSPLLDVYIWAITRIETGWNLGRVDIFTNEYIEKRRKNKTYKNIN